MYSFYPIRNTVGDSIVGIFREVIVKLMGICKHILVKVQVLVILEYIKYKY